MYKSEKLKIIFQSKVQLNMSFFYSITTKRKKPEFNSGFFLFN
jgi:hypothetical protein